MADQTHKTSDQTSRPNDPSTADRQPAIESQRRNSTDTTRTTLPTYSSLATDTPPAYSYQPNATPDPSKPVFQQPRNPASAATIRAIMGDPPPREPINPASAATIRAIMGDPPPEEPRRSLRDRLLCRRPTYNRRRPSSERGRESSARWNILGSPISDPNK